MNVSPQERWIGEVLRFWFEEVASERRFAPDERPDAQSRERFAALHERLAHAPLEDFATPEACLAGVIVLDQFPRNMRRVSARAFASDSRALALAQRAIELGFDREPPAQQRMFL
ncbi:MAG TPA: DUF924 family protein [Steroidobacter sp.]|nr:DUF924 family protein [Steroidobacter sp.]